MNNEEIIGIYEDMLAMLNQIADTNRKSLTKERYETMYYTLKEIIDELKRERSNENKIKNILKKAGYEEREEGIYELDGGYKLALKYFEANADMYEFLENLDEEERENIHFTSIINIKEKTAKYRIGSYLNYSQFFARYSDSIDNTVDEDDDFDGVISLVVEELTKESE